MKGAILSLVVVLLVILGCFGAGANQITARTKNLREYVPGEVIVGFYKTIDVKNINSFEGYNIKDKIEDLNVAVFEVSEGSEQTFINSAAGSPSVRYAEYNWIVHAYLTPNDPMWGQQWGPQRIHCAEAWDSGTGSSSVKIAIVDTGIDYNHEDIAGNYVTGGHDWVNSDNDPMDDNNHGTHCAGIAAAVMNNNKGIAGVAQVKVMAEKVLNSGGQGTSDNCANGITHAADNGANVISMSWGSSGPSSAIEDACNYAYNTKGIVLVAASGNDGQPQVSYPAAYDSVIAVGAINQNDQRCDFSNYGDKLELMAPGYQVLSTVRNNQYDSYDGTSMACPHVSGVAALAISKNPGENNIWIRQLLKESAEDLGPPGWDQEYGYGLVDARLLNNFVTINKTAREYYQKDSGWRNWGDHGMDCDNYWSPTNNDRIYYNFTVPHNTPGSVFIGAYFKADGVPWNGGPDLEAYNPSSGEWVKIKQSMGKPSTLVWAWYEISKDYISGSDEVKFCMLCAAGCHAYLDTVGVKYTPLPPPPQPKPDLDCQGSLSWADVKPGGTVTGSFIVKNVGESGSKLNWSIVEYPDWGTWSFNPSSGNNLLPGSGVTVDVSVTAPNQQQQTFSGTIKVVNKGNSSDYDTVSISLITPRSRSHDSMLLAYLLQRLLIFKEFFYNFFHDIR